MAYRFLADAVAVVHGLFVLFVVAGGLIAFHWPRVAWVQLPCAAYGVLVEWVGWVCPLTPLEDRLRRLAGEAGHPGGFVEHRLLPLLYPQPFPPWLAAGLGASVVVLNLAVYAALLLRGRRGKQRTS